MSTSLAQAGLLGVVELIPVQPEVSVPAFIVEPGSTMVSLPTTLLLING